VIPGPWLALRITGEATGTALEESRIRVDIGNEKGLIDKEDGVRRAIIDIETGHVTEGLGSLERIDCALLDRTEVVDQAVDGRRLPPGLTVMTRAALTVGAER
jgi:hypothetical protein